MEEIIRKKLCYYCKMNSQNCLEIEGNKECYRCINYVLKGEICYEEDK